MTTLPEIKPALLTAAQLPALAVQALMAEVALTPKPGLVDRANCGAHRDMDYPLFLASIAAISPWLTVFYQLGGEFAWMEAPQQLRQLRPAGIACEQAMFRATAGVNTHKGGIFSLGLLCAAAGRLEARDEKLSQQQLCATVSAFAQGIVGRELATRGRAATAGERIYQRYGLSGARGEAESGFVTLRRYLLPDWFSEADPQRRMHQALLRLMAHNPDTNLVSRGGLSGLRYVQRYAARLLRQGWQREDLEVMDAELIKRNLSPGGSADLLAVGWVLAEVGG